MREEAVDQPTKSSESIPCGYSDWVWPDADVFQDGTIEPRISQTCSELGSKRIRLIKILPGCLGDTIECETRVCFLSQAEGYTALSYAWGSPVARCRIIMDNQPRQITTNLWRFLRQARQLPNQFSGWMWIDALSIDQSDPWEKLEQVKKISDIFRSAKRAVVWLGQKYGDGDKVMKVLATRAPSPSGKWPRTLYAAPLGPAILGLCERAYWRRLWVFQELKCTRSIILMCGDQHLNFAYLKRFLLAENVDERVDVHCKNHVHQSSAAEMVKLTREDPGTSLRMMLDVTSHLKCNDARDRVYAILNTIDSRDQDIEADYTITLSRLLNKVVRNMHSIESPRNLRTVATQCSSLANLFGVDVRVIYGVNIDWDGSDDRPENSKLLFTMVHKWCTAHHHKVINALAKKELVDDLSSIKAYFNDSDDLSPIKAYLNHSDEAVTMEAFLRDLEVAEKARRPKLTKENLEGIRWRV